MLSPTKKTEKFTTSYNKWWCLQTGMLWLCNWQIKGLVPNRIQVLHLHRGTWDITRWKDSDPSRWTFIGKTEWNRVGNERFLQRCAKYREFPQTYQIFKALRLYKLRCLVRLRFSLQQKQLWLSRMQHSHAARTGSFHPRWRQKPALSQNVGQQTETVRMSHVQHLASPLSQRDPRKLLKATGRYHTSAQPRYHATSLHCEVALLRTS